MSRQAIAAVLARQDLSSGERLVAFSLASFADRDGRARPGTPAAAGRAGLKRSWFLEARDILERRGLIVVEDAATGRGRASTLWLPFVDAGPWWEGEINPELFEAMLSYSRFQGAVRLLLAAMAALADTHRVVERVTTRTALRRSRVLESNVPARAGCVAHLRGAVSPERYRRQGQHELLGDFGSAVGGGEVEPVARRRLAPPAGQRPLLASVASTPATAAELGGGTGGSVSEDLPVARGKGGGERTVSGRKRTVTAGVPGRKGGGERTLSPVNHPASAGVSVGKGGADRTVSRETPAETPAPNAGGGREPQNPRTLDPQPPLEGGRR